MDIVGNPAMLAEQAASTFSTVGASFLAKKVGASFLAKKILTSIRTADNVNSYSERVGPGSLRPESAS